MRIVPWLSAHRGDRRRQTMMNHARRDCRTGARHQMTAPGTSAGRRRARRFVPWVLSALLALCAMASLPSSAAPARAATAPDVNDTCLACHGDKEAKRADGRSIFVDAATFAQSVHGEMQLQCTSCHTDVSPQKLPHPEKLKP